MTTLGDLVIETQRHGLSGLREEINQLGSSITAGATTISLSTGQTLGSIQPDAVLQIDYELFFVTAAPNTASITVIPGYQGSTQAAHSANTIINVNPRFPAVDIIKSINEELDSLSAPALGLYQVLETTLTFVPVIVGYDMTGVVSDGPGSLLDVLEVRVHDFGPFQRWPLIPPSKYKVQRNADPSIFPSGMALEMYKAGYPGRPIRVQYKAAYKTPLVNSTDDVKQVTGLHTQAHDIPVLGALYRLMQVRELKRSFTEAQGEPRRAQEVPVGSSLTAMKGIMQHRLDRISEEKSRLDMQYRRQYR